MTAHLVDLAYSTYERLSLILWFLRWIVYNLTGRTVLAQCVIEAYGFIQAEWALVAVEDHEEKGSKKKPDREGQRKPKGLTRWQALRGILELYCLHSVTRERYLQEGAGLRKLDGWSRKSKYDESSKATKMLGSDRVDIGAHRAASRAALGEKQRSWTQADGPDGQLEEDQAAIMNGTRSASQGNEAQHQNAMCQEDYRQVKEPKTAAATSMSTYDDDDDDEMIVSNRGDDILEFAKTPRLDAATAWSAMHRLLWPCLRLYDFASGGRSSTQLGST